MLLVTRQNVAPGSAVACPRTLGRRCHHHNWATGSPSVLIQPKDSISVPTLRGECWPKDYSRGHSSSEFRGPQSPPGIIRMQVLLAIQRLSPACPRGGSATTLPMDDGQTNVPHCTGENSPLTTLSKSQVPFFQI